MLLFLQHQPNWLQGSSLFHLGITLPVSFSSVVRDGLRSIGNFDLIMSPSVNSIHKQLSLHNSIFYKVELSLQIFFISSVLQTDVFCNSIKSVLVHARSLPQ